MLSLHKSYILSVANVVYMTGELAHRAYSIYRLVKIMKKIPLQDLENNEQEDACNGFAKATVEEADYNPRRESLVPGCLQILLRGE